MRRVTPQTVAEFTSVTLAAICRMTILAALVGFLTLVDLWDAHVRYPRSGDDDAAVR
jgi:hypothetical protein